jgi:uncharacterized protein (DUF1697 family)
VALLRGINVGKAQRLPMVELMRLLEELGCRSVRTVLNSGNAVFDSPPDAPPAQLAQRLHESIHRQLGLTVPVQVRSAAQWRAVVAANAIGTAASDASRLLVIFAAHGHDIAACAPAPDLLAPNERLHVGPAAAYLWCPDGILESRAALALLGKKGQHVTTRNWATVLRLADLL